MITSRRFFVTLASIFFACFCSCCQGAPSTPAAVEFTPTLITLTPFQPLSPTLTPSPEMIPTPTPFVCKETQGKIQAYQLDTVNQRQPLQYRLYLPPCYDTAPVDCYPVLYILHGQTFHDDQWERLGIGKVADNLIINAEVKPFLIVMPDEENTYADIFLEGFPIALIDDLVPMIDSQYRICPGRQYHAIGGLSRGGAWSVRLGLLNWNLFAAIGAHSTPPFTGDLQRIPGWIQAIPVDLLPRIYVDTATNDYFRPDSTALEEVLTRLDVPHEWKVSEGSHDESYWQAHVEDYLRWYASAWDS